MAKCNFCGFTFNENNIICSHCNEPIEKGIDLSEIRRMLILFLFIVVAIVAILIVGLWLTAIYPNLFWGTLLFLIGFMLFYQMYYNFKIAEESKSWPTTQGTVLYTYIESRKVTSSSSSSTPIYIGNIIYQYEVQGVKFISNRIGPRQSPSAFTSKNHQEIETLLKEYPIASKITVYYNPREKEVKSWPKNWWNHYQPINEKRIPSSIKIWDEKNMKIGNSAITPGHHSKLFFRVLQLIGFLMIIASLYLLLTSNLINRYITLPLPI